MATNAARQNKMMKRTFTKKSHSWWWDSHISPKNSRWLQENLEEMDQHVKRMLKLIEEDADSFAKKAEMYYQKRPELVSLVEEFYRMYRSLAERYDQITGELRKSVPSDLQSQGSGISDVSSELPSSMPSPDRRPSRTKSGPRAAGFEFFLGATGNSPDVSNKDRDDLSTLDSESESDDSSINNYAATLSSDDDQGLRRRITELEVELQDMKDKLQTAQNGGSNMESCEIHLSTIAGYEEELKLAGEKIRTSEEQMSTLRDELQKNRSMDFSNIVESSSILEEQVDGDLEQNIHPLEEEIRFTKGKLLDSEKEVARLTVELKNNGASIQALQDQLGSAQKETSLWKSKFDKEKREVLKLHDRITRYKSNLADREQEIRGLRETIGNANKTLSEENSQLQVEITRLLKEKTYLEDNLKEMDHRCQSLEEDARRIKAAKEEMEGVLEGEITEKNDQIAELNRNLDTLRGEKNELDAKIASCLEEISSKEAHLNEMNMHLHQLHMEHVQLITQAEGARKQVEEMGSKLKEMERDVERKQELILEGAEEKREAIRQLCFSLEHYRNGYHRLREAFIGHRPVMAS